MLLEFMIKCRPIAAMIPARQYSAKQLSYNSQDLITKDYLQPTLFLSLLDLSLCVCVCVCVFISYLFTSVFGKNAVGGTLKTNAMTFQTLR